MIFARLRYMGRSAAINEAIEALPAELKDPVSRWFERLAEQNPLPEAAVVPDLVRVVACSEFAAGVLLKCWDELGDRLDTLAEPPDLTALASLAQSFETSDIPIEAAQATLRRERNQKLTHILWRDLVADTSVGETLEALSELADQLLTAAANCAQRLMLERFGVLRDQQGAPVPMVIIGMGKLGGRELNFSSDVDLIFTYPSDGYSDGRKQLHAQQYFDRLSRYLIMLLDEVTADGFVYRTDTRLRPFGDSGPPVVSFAALESYLLQHARDWERYAYVKARIVGRQPPEAVRNELFGNLIVPFVYRRYLDYGVFESLREMHAMISAEVKRRELADNVKLGPGGIREIEFIVQSIQLVRGGRQREMQTPSLQAVLPLLVDAKGLDRPDVEALGVAYRFLRRLENYLQAFRDKQTHDLPDSSTDKARLCFAMRAPDWAALVSEIDGQRAVVSTNFDKVAFRSSPDAQDRTLGERFAGLWEQRASADDWQRCLEDCGFERPDEVAAEVVTFQESRATQSIDTLASERLATFMPLLLTLARECEHPARAVSRSLSVVEQVLRRSAYIALLNENRVAAERLVSLCEQSAQITAELARFPVLLDELLDPRLICGPMSRQALTAELDDRLAGAGDMGSEEQMELLAQFQRANMFRVAVADFSGELPIMKVSDSLTFLAETVLEHTLAVAWQDLVVKHGQPSYEADNQRHKAGFAIIAYGKLGGLELSYGSDLDIVFLHDSRGSAQTTDGERPLDNAMFFSRLVRRLVHFLTTRTSTGELYEIDTRLRPSGRKGLLVTSIDAFERYQEENAWTWEHQALLRARPVAGSRALGAEFDRVRAETLTRRVRRDSLKDDVLSMRARMRKELDKSDSSTFDLKQGVGGIGDIEFLVQYLVLRNADQYPSVYEFTDNIRQLDALADCSIVSGDTASTLQDIYRRYRLCQHHLVLDDESSQVAGHEFVDERALVVNAWHEVFGT